MYHDRWRIISDVQKFEQVLEFGRSPPQLRAVADQDLMLDGLARPRVLAGMVRLLDLGFFRVGGEEYAKEHETFGIATLLKEHVRLSRGQMIFDYPAKGSVQRVVRVSDEAAFEALQCRLAQRGLRRRGGLDYPWRRDVTFIRRFGFARSHD
jgi:DNA topoisomerase IB